MEIKVLENVRFRHINAALDIWQTANPIILSGELVLVKDENGRMKIKIGTGMPFNDTAYLYSMDRWTSKYKNLTVADDANIKPADAKGYNTEDFLQIAGDLIYPISLTTSVRLKDGSKLQTWMDNVHTGNITMTGDLSINRGANGVRNVLKVLSDDQYGASIHLGAGANTVITSGEAKDIVIPLLTTNSEQLYLASDQSIFLYTGCQTADTTKYIAFNGSAFYPGSNNNIDLGLSSYRWKDIYAYSIRLYGTLNADKIDVNGHSTTTVKGISGNMGSDCWRIGGALPSDSATDSGYLEIATGDNGTESIYVRQYQGSNYSTLVRTLTLLDESGSSKFPGNIYEKGAKLEDKYLQRSGVLPMTGNLDMGVNGVIFNLTNSGSSAVGIRFKNSDGYAFGGIGVYGSNGVADHIYIGAGDNPWNVTSGLSISTTQFKYKNNTIWHAGNDGTGSGLDADLLDGKHASEFSLTSHGHTILDNIVSTYNSTLDINKYVKIVEYKLNAIYSFIATTFECITSSHGKVKNDYFRLHVWIKQQDELGKDPLVYISSSGRDNNIKYTKFYAQIDETTSTYTKVSLYAKILNTYTELKMVRMIQSQNAIDITYEKNISYIDSLPEAGKIIEEVDSTGNHLHTKSQIIDFPTSLPNAGALTISLNGVSQGAYDGSAAKAFDITPTNIGALSTEGGTVTGATYFRQGLAAFSTTGAGQSDKTNYVLMAEISINAAYQNTPVIFEVVDRRAKQSMILSVLFKNANTDPELDSFTYYGYNIGAYIHKASAGTWNLYIKKSEAYDSICVTRLVQDIGYTATVVTWKNIQIETLPSGYVTAILLLNASSSVKLATARQIGNASFDGTANITAAQMGVAPANLIYKNITIATSAWNTSTKKYEYANASITANHSPIVNFNRATLDAAGKAGIIVYTEAGKLVFEYTTIPTTDLVIETAILIPV